MIPAKNVLIGAITDHETACIAEVIVILDERTAWASNLNGAPKKWIASELCYGAINPEWLGGNHNMTPEWVFSEFMIRYGFNNSKVAEQAIAAFALIDECEWAQRMTPKIPIDNQDTYWKIITD